MKLAKLIKICLNGSSNGVRVGTCLCDMFSVKSYLLPLFLNFAVEHAISRVQANQDDLKLNGTNQFLVYADDINILGGSIHTIRKNIEALVIASKETGLEVKAEKTKYMTCLETSIQNKITV